MTSGELIKYFSSFPEDSRLGLLVANPKGRKLHEVRNFLVITDQPHPVICIEVSDAVDMDEEMVRICEEEEANKSV